MYTHNNEVSPAGVFGAVWGAGGLVVILLDAINRLGGIALGALRSDLGMAEYAALGVVVIAMAYAEGYRGFQKSFSPRCAARTWYLYRNPEPLAILLAPVFVMGFFRATRGPLLFAWVGTAMIVLLIIALQYTAQPWRGIIDTGVVVGLSWGVVSFAVSLYRVFRSAGEGVSPEVPPRATAAARV